MIAQGAFAERSPQPRRREPRSIAKRGERRDSRRAKRWRRCAGPGDDVRGRPPVDEVRRPSSRDSTHRSARASRPGGGSAGAPGAGARRATRRSGQRLTEQLERVEGERGRAEQAGDRRRALRLQAQGRSAIEDGNQPRRRSPARRHWRAVAALRDPAPRSRPDAGPPSARRRLGAARPRAPRRRSARDPRAPSPRSQLSVDRELARLRESLKAEGRMPPAGARDPSESVVMRDAREVEAGRKRLPRAGPPVSAFRSPASISGTAVGAAGMGASAAVDADRARGRGRARGHRLEHFGDGFR